MTGFVLSTLDLDNTYAQGVCKELLNLELQRWEANLVGKKLDPPNIKILLKEEDEARVFERKERAKQIEQEIVLTEGYKSQAEKVSRLGKKIEKISEDCYKKTKHPLSWWLRK